MGICKEIQQKSNPQSFAINPQSNGWDPKRIMCSGHCGVFDQIIFTKLIKVIDLFNGLSPLEATASRSLFDSFQLFSYHT